MSRIASSRPRHSLRLQAVLVVLATAANLGAIAAVSPLPAFAAAANCGTGAPSQDATGQGWNQSSGVVGGLRAPIKVVTDAVPCNETHGHEPGFNAIWIGIQNSSFTMLAQIGYEAVYDSLLGGPEYCRFWAIGTGIGDAVPYGACAPTNNQTTYFMITVQSGHYALYDCGANAAYSSTACGLPKNADQAVFKSANGSEISENDYPSCVIVQMGAPSDHVTFGNATDSTQYQTAVGGGWGAQNFNLITKPTCAHYKETFTTKTTLDTWDTTTR